MLIFKSSFLSRRKQNTVYEMIPRGGESGWLLWATTGPVGVGAE